MLLLYKKGIRWLSNKLFFLTKIQKRQFNTIKYNNIEDYKTWSIYSTILPLAAYTFAFLVNLIYLWNHPCKLTVKNIFSTLNNGSLPIIAFGIMTSGIPYLLEVIESDTDNDTRTNIIGYLRKKVMAVAVVFLFLTSALYILQSMNRDFIFLSDGQEVIIFITTLLILILSFATGGKMFLLQKNTIIKDKANALRKKTKGLTDGLVNQFDLNGFD